MGWLTGLEPVLESLVDPRRAYNCGSEGGLQSCWGCTEIKKAGKKGGQGLTAVSALGLLPDTAIWSPNY